MPSRVAPISHVLRWWTLGSFAVSAVDIFLVFLNTPPTHNLIANDSVLKRYSIFFFFNMSFFWLLCNGCNWSMSTLYPSRRSLPLVDSNRSRSVLDKQRFSVFCLCDEVFAYSYP